MSGRPDPNVMDSNTLVVMIGKGYHEFPLPDVCADMEVRQVPKGHPAYPGFGVFATKKILKPCMVALYAGVVQTSGILPLSSFDFEMRDYVINASTRGNISRYFNDPRGTGKEPNMWFRDSRGFWLNGVK